MKHLTLSVIGATALLAGCTSPEQQAADARMDMAIASLPPSARIQCELQTRSMPSRPGEGFLEQIGRQGYNQNLCLKIMVMQSRGQ